MTPQAIKQLQAQLGVPATGVFDTATSSAMTKAVSKSISSNPAVKKYAGSNDPAAILNAYMTGDWSGVVSLTGKPFTEAQQQAAVKQAETALAPAYKEQEAYDKATVEDTLRNDAEQFGDFQKSEKRQFGLDKDALDQNAADQGVLFAGSRVQKQNDLRSTYADRENRTRRDMAESVGATTRGYQYDYGDDAARGLRDLYRLPETSVFDASAAHGPVRSSSTLSSVYDPKAYSFQGRKPVAQKANVQTRAASLLANKANKLSLSGVGAKF